MPKYRVPVKTVNFEIYHITASSAYAAMNVAIEASEELNHEDLVDETDGDPEVYYHDITEVKE